MQSLPSPESQMLDSDDSDALAAEVESQLSRANIADKKAQANQASEKVWRKKGFTMMGHAWPGDEESNLEKFGSISPYHRYCFSMPGISATDLAKEWNTEPDRVYNWIARGGWNKVRQKWLETIPVHNGGMLAVEEEEERRQFIAQARANWQEVSQITMDRIRQRQQEEPAYDASKGLMIQKQSDQHLKDVQALDVADSKLRLAYGLPTKLSAQMISSTHRREEVRESVVQAPARRNETYEVDEAIDPPALPPLGNVVEGQIVETSTTLTVTASAGEDEESL